ncbi:MAG: hypothetical protein GF308_16705 [Candidatus Heimdallarchaeota archaeon]|nr:hypothetical protein [Candidatus Heimdallarchaeota archaeon]
MIGKKQLVLKIFVGIFAALLVGSTLSVQPIKIEAQKQYFTLVAKTGGGGVRGDYLNLAKQQLARIGINLNIYVLDWPSIVSEILFLHNYDLIYIALTGGGADPDFTGVYDEEGPLNVFGYDTNMDYNETLGTGVNQWYMEQGNLIMPPYSEERIQHYWAWEQYLMDKICPCLPTFAPKDYTVQWANLQGYNKSDGIFQSWGKMFWDSLHPGQQSEQELVIADASWSDLNPLFLEDSSSSFISEATLDPLIWYDANLQPWPHLASGWEMLNETHFRVHIREGVKWQTDPDGNFTNEWFDAEDVYFTFYCLENISFDEAFYGWIEKMEIVDQYTIDFFIDGNSTTEENEIYAPFFPSLAKSILPEHYLTQTQEADGVTPDTSHSSWEKFSEHCFGTSILQFDSFTKDKETILTVFPDCWWLNNTITSDPALDWAQRFGDFWELQQLRIRIIPDSYTALSEFEAGKIDIAGITFSPEIREEYQSNPDFLIQSEVMFYYAFFGYNMREDRDYIGSREPCPNDSSMSIGFAVRKAISYAIDREEINNIVHKGEYVITHHPIYHKMGIWCNPNIIRYDHNLEQARFYLEKAGFLKTTTTEPATTSTIVNTIVVPGNTILISLVSLATITMIVIKITRKRKKG